MIKTINLYPNKQKQFCNNSESENWRPAQVPPASKWVSEYFPRQSQHHWYLHSAHVMWLQPLFFSVQNLHLGHCLTILSFFHRRKSLSISVEHFLLPCHSLRHTKQNLCPLSHVTYFSFSSFRSATPSQFGWGQNFKFGLEINN